MNCEKIRGYSALDPRRQAVVRAIAGGQSLHEACHQVGLNNGREKKNVALQKVLYRMTMRDDSKPATAVDELLAGEIIAPERLNRENGAAMYECVRRIDRDMGGKPHAGNPAFAAITFTYPPGHVTHDWLLERGLSTRLVPDAEVTHAK